MTKYVLNSGNAKKFSEKLKKYNEEVFKDFIDRGVDACKGWTSACTPTEHRCEYWTGNNFFGIIKRDFEVLICIKYVTRSRKIKCYFGGK